MAFGRRLPVAQSFRYAVTKDEDAYKSAINMLKSIETLFNVTGVGLPARTMVPENKYKNEPDHWGGTSRRRKKGGGL